MSRVCPGGETRERRLGFNRRPENVMAAPTNNPPASSVIHSPKGSEASHGTPNEDILAHLRSGKPLFR